MIRGIKHLARLTKNEDETFSVANKGLLVGSQSIPENVFQHPDYGETVAPDPLTEPSEADANVDPDLLEVPQSFLKDNKALIGLASQY